MDTLTTRTLREHSRSVSPLTPFTYRVFRRNPWLFQAILKGEATLPELSDNQIFAELVAEHAFPNASDSSFVLLDFENRRSGDYKKQAADALNEGKYPILKPQVERVALFAETLREHPQVRERLDSIVYPAGTEICTKRCGSLEISCRPSVVMEDMFIIVKVLRSFEDMATAARVGRWIEQLCFHRACVQGPQVPAILAIEDSEAPRTRLVKLNVDAAIPAFRDTLYEYLSEEWWSGCQHITDCRTAEGLHTWRVFEM